MSNPTEQIKSDIRESLAKRGYSSEDGITFHRECDLWSGSMYKNRSLRYVLKATQVEVYRLLHHVIPTPYGYSNRVYRWRRDTSSTWKYRDLVIDPTTNLWSWRKRP